MSLTRPGEHSDVKWQLTVGLQPHPPDRIGSLQEGHRSPQARDGQVGSQGARNSGFIGRATLAPRPRPQALVAV